MRLICPNCSAQYEVPAEVIPEDGRDVQCSNCGNTWFQNHPDDDPVLAEELNQPLPDTEWQSDADVEEAAVPADEGPDPDDGWQAEALPPQESASDDNAEDAHDEAPDPAAEPEAAPVRRRLDPAVADVLRQEAQHEARVRAGESGNLESQPDLGLKEPDDDDAARRAREARDRMVRMRGESTEAPPPQAAAAAAAAASSRRELLPDIDEINQTLRSSSERRAVETPQGRAPEEPRRSGFARGFRSVILLAILAIAVYVAAPRIMQALPASEPALSAYVEAVNVGRVWLDGQVTEVLTLLKGASGA